MLPCISYIVSILKKNGFSFWRWAGNPAGKAGVLFIYFRFAGLTLEGLEALCNCLVYYEFGGI